jgi:HK97 gp10 family phage protein
VSDSLKIKVDGLKALQGQLLEFGAVTAAKALGKAARKAFKPVLDAAIAGAPVDSGDLRASLKITVSKPKSGESVVVVGLRFARMPPRPGSMQPARRWHFAEFGTAFQRAKPFVRPALDANAPLVTELLAREINAQIAKLRRKSSQ